MAVCKKCGCAIPIGRKTCDMCAAVGSVAPAQQVWTAPKEASGPQELASSAASWAAAAGAPRPASRTNLQTAEKHVRSAWRWLAIVGTMYIVLGLPTALGYVDDVHGLFGWWAVGIGAAFLTLAYFVRRGEILALVLAIAIYALYTIAFFASGSFAFFRLIVLAWLLRSLLSMYNVRQHRQAQAQQPPSDQTRVA